MLPGFTNTIDLMLAFRNGESIAFDHLFNKYYKAIFYFVFKIVKDDLAAEDIATDGFIKLWEKKETITTEASLRSYLYKTVYNFSLKWIGRNRSGAQAGSVQITSSRILHCG